MNGGRRPADCPTHGKARPAPDDDFFAPVPPEIGRLLTVQTTLRRGEDPAPLRGWSLRLLGLGREPSSCTYVGTEGWSRHWLRSRDRNDIEGRVFRFAEAVGLHTSELRINSGGPKRWETRHSRIWRDAHGREVAKLTGVWRGSEDKPPPTDPWWFALSAESAWNLHWLAEHREALLSGDPIEFPMRRDRRMSIGKGFIEFDWGKRASRIPLEEIVMLDLLGDWFRLEVADKSLFRRGALRLRNSEIPNLQGFLYSVSRVLGYPMDEMGRANAGEGAARLSSPKSGAPS